MKKVRKYFVFLLAAAIALSAASFAVSAESPVNHPPRIDASTQMLTLREGTQGSVILAAADAEGDNLRWYADAPAKGWVSILPGIGSISVTYTPKPNAAGSDSFTVHVSDGRGGSDSAVITVAVEEQKTLRYTALGDSIGTGTIYPGKRIETYVTYFSQYLETEYGSGNVTAENFCEDGDTTGDLLGWLQVDGSRLVQSVMDADVITVSIGGNNLMQACADGSALGGYDFNSINIARAELGRADFQTQFPKIIKRIKALNPDAAILVNSLYNPYNPSDAAMRDTVESFLFNAGSGINDVIYADTGLGYSVADVYTAFQAYAEEGDMGAVTYFYPTDLWGRLTRNPHPKALGQSILYRLNAEEYKTAVS